MAQDQEDVELISLLKAVEKRKGVVSHETLRRAAKAKKLKATKVGSSWATTLRDVDEYLAKYPPVVGRPRGKKISA